jgi:hypothetical protein
MCGTLDDPQMTVQVALNGNEIRFENGAPIQPYAALSTAWHARGVPLNWPDPLPLSPERAVRFVWETFGVRVTEVPELYFRGNLSSSNTFTWYQIGSTRFCNRLLVTLESDVRIRGTTSLQEFTTRFLWIAPLSCNQRDVVPWIHVPLADQPATVTLDYFDESFSPSKRWTFEATVAAPIRFEIGTRAP